jgi:hypothetical protein
LISNYVRGYPFFALEMTFAALVRTGLLTGFGADVPFTTRHNLTVAALPQIGETTGSSPGFGCNRPVATT